MTTAPLSISTSSQAFGQPANDRRAAPPRRVLPPAQRQEIAAMAAAYLRDLGVRDPDRLMRLGVRLVERVENRAPTPREEIMLTAFEEMQGLIGEEAGATATRADMVEVAGRLGLWLAAAPAAMPAEPVPVGSPLAPELPEMTPQTLETWYQRVQALGRSLVRWIFGGAQTPEPTAAIRVDA
jgi:hypothetical protein